MNINSDFTQRVVMHADDVLWAASPTPGVDRRMLDRLGGEVARATSFVRYAPDSRFPSHQHGGGEEFIVLEGVFQDEHADYPVGTYVRNPPTSHHSPGSARGCTIFVKLWQFDPDDRTTVVLDMNVADLEPDPVRRGVQTATLFVDHHETVRLERWSPGTHVDLFMPNGGEVLVLDGNCIEHGEFMRRHSWLRIPHGGRLDAVAGDEGTRLWIKIGGLRPV